MSDADPIAPLAQALVAAEGPMTLANLCAAAGLSPSAAQKLLTKHDRHFARVAGASSWEWALTEYGLKQAGASAPKAPRSTASAPSAPRPGRRAARAPRVPATPVSDEPLPPVITEASEVAAVVEQVTPAHARAYLGKSQGNRLVRMKHIAWLAEQMAAGQWMIAQPVLFSTTGRLLDGHHRLSAVIASGATVPMVIVRGLPDQAWSVLDCGVVRQVHDRLVVLDGHSRINRRAIEILQQRRRLAGQKLRPTVEQISADWETFGGAVRMVLNVFAASVKGLTRAPALVALVEYCQRDEESATRITQQLRSGTGLGAYDPVRLLRDWLVTGAVQAYRAGGDAGARMVYQATVWACVMRHRRREEPELGRLDTWPEDL